MKRPNNLYAFAVIVLIVGYSDSGITKSPTDQDVQVLPTSPDIGPAESMEKKTLPGDNLSQKNKLFQQVLPLQTLVCKQQMI